MPERVRRKVYQEAAPAGGRQACATASAPVWPAARSKPAAFPEARANESKTKE